MYNTNRHMQVYMYIICNNQTNDFNSLKFGDLRIEQLTGINNVII